MKYLYIKLRRSRLSLTFFCSFSSPNSAMGYADERIVSIMKLCIKSDKLQVELIRCSTEKNVDFIHVCFCEVTDSHAERMARSFEHKPIRLRF